MRHLVVLLLAGLLTSVAVAEKRGKSGGGGEGSDGSKRTLDFDGDVVEGMNRQPLDSLTSLSEGSAGGAKNHLYQRKKKPKKENRELAREIAETY